MTGHLYAWEEEEEVILYPFMQAGGQLVRSASEQVTPLLVPFFAFFCEMRVIGKT